MINLTFQTWRAGPVIPRVDTVTSCDVIHDPKSLHPVVVAFGDGDVNPVLWDTVTDTVRTVTDSDHVLPTAEFNDVVAINKYTVAVASMTEGYFTYSITGGLTKIGDTDVTRTLQFTTALIPRNYMKCPANM